MASGARGIQLEGTVGEVVAWPAKRAVRTAAEASAAMELDTDEDW